MRPRLGSLGAPQRTVEALERTPVYDLFWRFAAERQAIYFRRLEGSPEPFTTDPILKQYKFTNAYRSADRVSQFLIRDIIYKDSYPNTSAEVVFRTLLFKLFNKEQTWRLIETQLGTPTWQGFDFARYDRVLTAAAAAGQKLYSGAYIIPPVKLVDTGVKHHGHFRLIELIMQGDFVRRLQQTTSLQEVFELLKAYPSLGDFLGFQLAIDLNYSTVINHDESQFVVAGPGARDGIAKTFLGAADVDARDVIQFMMEQQDAEFGRLGLEFRSLWGRPLQLIDCQNLFCEISKYTRISNPEIAGLSGRTRIKQMFRPQANAVQPWFPPKWQLNARIPNYAATTFADELFAVKP